MLLSQSRRGWERWEERAGWTFFPPKCRGLETAEMLRRITAGSQGAGGDAGLNRLLHRGLRAVKLEKNKK